MHCLNRVLVVASVSRTFVASMYVDNFRFRLALSCFLTWLTNLSAQCFNHMWKSFVLKMQSSTNKVCPAFSFARFDYINLYNIIHSAFLCKKSRHAFQKQISLNACMSLKRNPALVERILRFTALLSFFSSLKNI